jgi:hypothetical protein
MRLILRWCALCASVAIVSLFALPVGAVYADENGGHTIVVHPGQSIQAAIDKAAPGSTIVVESGTYKENLAITKDHITLKSEHGLGSVLLKPPATPTLSICLPDPSKPVSGICASGQVDPITGNFERPVTGTRIDGFVVAGFSDFGVVLFNAVDSAVTNTRARNNQTYGISGFGLKGVRFVNNIAHDNAHPGFYIGDSPNANAYVVGNRSFRNGVGGATAEAEGFGFLFRDSSHGVVRDNSAYDNCAGFVFVDGGFNPEPLNDWHAVENSARNNNGTCTGEAGYVPATKGIGFALVGTQHVTLQENTARGNGTTGAEPKRTSGGIVVISAKGDVGGPDPTDNLIVENQAFGNSPKDIFWDESGSGNRFDGNRCKTSAPPRLCQSGRDD